MALNKKEKGFIDKLVKELEIQSALRWTEEVNPDIMPPKGGELLKGFSFNAYSMRVSESCASSQGSKPLYSSILLALKAMRYAVERKCAAELRTIDKMIEKERATLTT
jgi:hypothetical protein